MELVSQFSFVSWLHLEVIPHVSLMLEAFCYQIFCIWMILCPIDVLLYYSSYFFHIIISLIFCSCIFLMADFCLLTQHPIFQEQISRLNQENGSLKQNLTVTNAALSAARSESSKASSNGINALKVVSRVSDSVRVVWDLMVRNCGINASILNHLLFHGINE